jgi:hypothetical protein
LADLHAFAMIFVMPRGGRDSMLQRSRRIPFVDTSTRNFHSAISCGASIHEQFHPEEGVYEVIEGELGVCIVPVNVDRPSRRDFGA